MKYEPPTMEGEIHRLNVVECLGLKGLVPKDFII